MKLLHVVPSYLPAVRYGGPIYSVHSLCRAIAELGHDVHVFTTNVDGDGDTEVPLGVPVDRDGVRIWYFPSRIGRRLFYAPAMRRALRQRVGGFDIVHLHSVFLWPTSAAASESRRAGIPYVLSPRGMLHKDLVRRKNRWLKKLWISVLERRNIAGAEALHVTSGIEARELERFGFGMRAMANVPNGIEAPRRYPAESVSADIKETIGRGEYALYLGRIHWKKGLDRLVDAWDPDWECRLIIAGNDDEGHVTRLRTRLAGRQNVDFVARPVSAADKEALFSNARFFVLPSYSENFGNTVLEAMIRGLPVLVTEDVGASEIVSASGGGRVVSGDSLRHGICELLSRPEEARRSGERGRAYVAEHCTWDAVAQEMIETYRRCLASRGQDVGYAQ